ncbi:hypothetical protein RHSIM_Rhsim05G0219900 [Rhododendron simsii]|uniref:Leucine-rich repeat-containing N-terminal plant-type domain-containing protein n=1 Tax=Rhododendron simsii TaxID=118357 RepID=A0A834GWJ8_RHOSS|nr:hypothetical protein RHSIM_Rhsim05G0219900 [Rhododendron simsii]
MRLEFIAWFFAITTLAIFCFITIPVHSHCLENQKSLLLQLKNGLQFNPNSSVKLVNWARTNDCCQWNGVTCDHFGRVIGLDLNTESISGALNHSSSLFGLKFLEKLNLAYNSFNSTQIPSNFGILTNLRFSGTIPQCLIDTCTATLGILNVRNNNLTGNITGTFPEDCTLRTLDLSENLLEGPVPKSLANCANAEVLNLGNNNINGNFPCFLANLSNLRVLVLRSNKFHGNIHCRGIHTSIWPKLQIICLAFNNFSGTLPPKIFSQRKAMIDGGNAQADLNHLRFETTTGTYYEDTVTIINKGLQMELVKILTIFTALDFSNNRFKGEIPNTVGDMKSLYVLNLSHNALTGYIPSSIGNLSRLESLDLSRNKLDGSIPVTLASLTFLSFLNLAYNQLVGKIPSGTQLQSFPGTSYEGNKGLWGPPLNACCKEAELAPPTLDGTQSYTEVDDEINWVYIIATLGYTVGFGVIVGPLLYSNRWRQCYYKPIDRVIVKILPHRE